MGKKYLKGLGVFFLLIGIFAFVLTFNTMNITGNSVLDKIGGSGGYFFGIIFVLIGGMLLMSRANSGKNLAQIAKESGAIITDGKKLKKIAKKMGYEGREVKEGYQILDLGGTPLTVIPHHNISSGVYRSIITALATGESSFRKKY